MTIFCASVNSTPLGLPSGRSSISPTSGLDVVDVIPARASAFPLTKPAKPCNDSSITGLFGKARSSNKRSG